MARRVITEKAGTSRRLLVVLSDGLAYDHGYERVYGAADARRALGEARRQGIGCLCLTIGAGTDAAELAGCSAAPRTRRYPSPSSWPTSSARFSVPRCGRRTCAARWHDEPSLEPNICSALG